MLNRRLLFKCARWSPLVKVRRAGGSWVAIGLAPLGQLQIGALALLLGISVALGASGLALVTLAGATALLFSWARWL